MSVFDKYIERAVQAAFDSPEIQAKLDAVVADVVANHKGIQFIKAMQMEMLRVDPTMNWRDAWERARTVLLNFMDFEKIKFGDPRFDWSKEGAISLIQEEEIYYWESAA